MVRLRIKILVLSIVLLVVPWDRYLLRIITIDLYGKTWQLLLFLLLNRYSKFVPFFHVLLKSRMFDKSRLFYEDGQQIKQISTYPYIENLHLLTRCTYARKKNS
jgi:hypothetical protein